MTRTILAAIRRTSPSMSLYGLLVAATIGAGGCARPSAGNWAQLGPVLSPLPGGASLRPLTSRPDPAEDLAGATALHLAPRDAETASQ